MKICVYAICKNEEKFIPRWYESMKEADSIYVLDTGSTDNSVNILRKLGVIVKEKTINPWRFDVARNESLKMVPDDTHLCVCTDIDEVFEKGWRNKLEAIYNENINRYEYTYNWSIINNRPVISFICDKIHNKNDYIWVHPVHEVLLNVNNNEYRRKDESIVLNHYPDASKNRSSYLGLLELSIKEDPENDRNMHYLGREYMYYGRYQEAIDTLINHLNLKKAVWKDERCASMRFIGRCYKYLKRYKESELWYKLAIKEAPYLRDPYMEEAILYYELGNYKKCEYYIKKGLRINTHTKTYINELFSYNETPYDLLSICYYNLGKFKLSLKYINKALKINLDDERLINNKKIIQEKIELL